MSSTSYQLTLNLLQKNGTHSLHGDKFFITSMEKVSTFVLPKKQKFTVQNNALTLKCDVDFNK